MEISPNSDSPNQKRDTIHDLNMAPLQFAGLRFRMQPSPLLWMICRDRLRARVSRPGRATGRLCPAFVLRALPWVGRSDYPKGSVNRGLACRVFSITAIAAIRLPDIPDGGVDN